MTINAVLGSRAVSGIGFFLEYQFGMGVMQNAAGSLLNQPRKQFERFLKLLLLLGRKLLRDGRGEPVLLAALLSSSHVRHLGVRDIKVCRPSLGSGAPLTRSDSCSGITIALMDCGRMPSARARLETVAGPSFSSRRRTEACDGVRSPPPPCSR